MIRHILCVAVGGDVVSHLETGGRLLVQSFTRDPLEIFEGTRYVTVLGARFVWDWGFGFLTLRNSLLPVLATAGFSLAPAF